jgi:hypothetical protein
VTSWETCDAQTDDQYRRDFILKRPSTVGPWVALGLGVTLAAFLSYLVYVNLLLPPSPLAPEHTRHPEVTSSAPTARPRRALQRPPERRMRAMTVVPQGRAPNALLGGQGPALLPEYALPPGVPPGPPVSTQAAAR